MRWVCLRLVRERKGSGKSYSGTNDVSSLVQEFFSICCVSLSFKIGQNSWKRRKCWRRNFNNKYDYILCTYIYRFRLVEIEAFTNGIATEVVLYLKELDTYHIFEHTLFQSNDLFDRLFDIPTLTNNHMSRLNCLLIPDIQCGFTFALLASKPPSPDFAKRHLPYLIKTPLLPHYRFIQFFLKFILFLISFFL